MSKNNLQILLLFLIVSLLGVIIYQLSKLNSNQNFQVLEQDETESAATIGFRPAFMQNPVVESVV